ncbi:PucR family transcriptional regulator [Lipingzhangella rawalii]|uniref:PucR family transcriptional regulator n=1 Tax=Lipingzhangella rawalii TaxID=2055835 RepID=UPI00287B94DD|nr:helix-turn-helix domain-containing protein [Lipingzhangella rawalii]
MTSDDTADGLDGAAVATEASRRGGMPAEYLAGLVEILAAASRSGRQPTSTELDHHRTQGARAAENGHSLRTLLDLYLHAAEIGWDQLPGISDAATATQARSATAAALTALRRATGAACAGYEGAGADIAAVAETARQEFLDDLLYGRGDEGELASRAERFGLRLATQHRASVARAQPPFSPDDPRVRSVERDLVGRYGTRNILLAVREGKLVCVVPGALTAATGQFTHRLRSVLTEASAWRVGIGRPHPGPSGVARSVTEATDAIDIAERLELPARVVDAAELLVFPVLLRDRAAITDLVTTVLGPLCEARGGAEPLLATLRAFFACHGNSTAVARRLHVSVRTVTYRLERVRRLTGYTPTDSTQRFTLETAVVGAQLLGWPEEQ